MTTPRTPGRPPIPARERKDAQVILRVRRADKSRWVRRAQKAGGTLATWIIDKLNQPDPKP